MNKKITAMALSLTMCLTAAPGSVYAFDWGDAASELISGLSDAADGASQIAGEAAQNAAQIAEQASQIVGQAAQDASQIAGSLLADWSDDLDEMAQEVDVILSELQVSLEGKAAELGAATSETIDDLLESMGSGSQELVEAVTEASGLVTDTAGNVIDMASEKAQEVSETAQSVISLINDHGEQLAQIAQEAISDMDLSDPENLEKARAAAEEAVKQACEQGVLGTSLSEDTASLLAGIVSSTVIYGSEYGAGELTLSDYAQRMSELILNAGIPVGVGYLAYGLPVRGTEQIGRDVLLYLITLLHDEAQAADETESGGAVSLSEDQQYQLASFAQRVYSVRMGYTEYSEGTVLAEDLTAHDQAFLLYWYQYNCSWNDSRFTTAEDGWNIARKDDLDAVLREMFGAHLQEGVMDTFLEEYADRTEGDAVYMNAVGDFGDAGNYYFNKVSDCWTEGELLGVRGQVMAWNENMESYVHTSEYTAYFSVVPGADGESARYGISSVSVGL